MSDYSSLIPKKQLAKNLFFFVGLVSIVTLNLSSATAFSHFLGS